MKKKMKKKRRCMCEAGGRSYRSDGLIGVSGMESLERSQTHSFNVFDMSGTIPLIPFPTLQ
jgi:hypothetical protein